MREKLLTMVFVGLSFGALANATVTWNFGSTPAATQAQGVSYTSSGETIQVYGEQVNNATNNIVSSVTTYGGTNTLGNTSVTNTVANPGALFTVSAADNGGFGSGIAPYDPAEGSSGNMSNQLGITDSVQQNSDHTTGASYGNILELYLNSSIANGTTLSFLIQGPTNDPETGEATAVNVYTANSSSVLNPSAMNVFGTGLGSGSISTTSSTGQFQITKTSTNEFIAIEGDCHYLLLDSITTVPSGVPEPSFYGFITLAMVGLVFGARKMRARAAAAEQA